MAQPLWNMFLIPASSFKLQLLNRWPEGPLCWVLVFPTASYLQLIWSPTNWTSCAPSYIIIWRPPLFLRASQFRTQFNPSTVKVISWYSSRDVPVIYTGAFPILTAWPGSICYIFKYKRYIQDVSIFVGRMWLLITNSSDVVFFFVSYLKIRYNNNY